MLPRCVCDDIIITAFATLRLYIGSVMASCHRSSDMLHNGNKFIASSIKIKCTLKGHQIVSLPARVGVVVIVVSVVVVVVLSGNMWERNPKEKLCVFEFLSNRSSADVFLFYVVVSSASFLFFLFFCTYFFFSFFGRFVPADTDGATDGVRFRDVGCDSRLSGGACTTGRRRWSRGGVSVMS